MNFSLFIMQFNIQRLSFEVDHSVETLEEAKKALQDLIDKNHKSKTHKRSWSHKHKSTLTAQVESWETLIDYNNGKVFQARPQSKSDNGHNRDSDPLVFGHGKQIKQLSICIIWRVIFFLNAVVRCSYNDIILRKVECVMYNTYCAFRKATECIWASRTCQTCV